MMVRCNRVDLLYHPVCQAYLNMKWNAYGFYLHFCVLGLYVVFVAALTFYVTLNEPMDHSHLSNERWDNITNATDDHWSIVESIPTLDLVLLITVTIFSALSIIKEIFQIGQQGADYFLDLINYLEWSLYISAGIFTTTTLLCGNGNSYHFQWAFGAISVFLAWFYLLLHLQRFNISVCRRRHSIGEE
ncbi:PREDICTED: transient receptor potential cation channel subfamily A member 1-like [Priapulus caudatus]|uniref:Transient receptor potential cation channel subfamily A member 1-like n=1 Tax=Priapulus caudatus TaxID=37621 RepID=A0ABM1EXT4_PRICU|nr:PREDICTED: transient receptor potential cation channel subfamily A member 1-like [Priapulus caudatus]